MYGADSFTQGLQGGIQFMRGQQREAEFVRRQREQDAFQQQEREYQLGRRATLDPLQDEAARQQVESGKVGLANARRQSEFDARTEGARERAINAGVETAESNAQVAKFQADKRETIFDLDMGTKRLQQAAAQLGLENAQDEAVWRKAANERRQFAQSLAGAYADAQQGKYDKIKAAYSAVDDGWDVTDIADSEGGGIVATYSDGTKHEFPDVDSLFAVATRYAMDGDSFAQGIAGAQARKAQLAEQQAAQLQKDRGSLIRSGLSAAITAGGGMAPSTEQVAGISKMASDVYPDRAAAPQASPYNGTQPPAKFPNARRAPDGIWYAQTPAGWQPVLAQ